MWKNFFSKRTYIGLDKVGNKFYTEPIDESVKRAFRSKERRFFEPGNKDFDHKQLHALWRVHISSLLLTPLPSSFHPSLIFYFLWFIFFFFFFYFAELDIISKRNTTNWWGDNNLWWTDESSENTCSWTWTRRCQITITRDSCKTCRYQKKKKK